MIYVPNRRKAFQAGGGWTPPTTDLIADWDAGSFVYSDAGSTLCAADDPVYRWTDQYGSNIAGDQTDGTKRPLWRSSVTALNNLPALDFDGSNDWLDIADTLINFTTGTTTYVVFKSDSTVGNAYVIASNSKWYFPLRIGSSYWRFDAGAGSVNTAGSVAADTNPHIASMWHSGTQFAAFLDGSQVGSTTADTKSGTGSLVNIGSFNEGGGSYWNGCVARLLIYHAAHDATTRASIEDALATIYGL